ncbi:hypothetical protein B7463_g4249, partial [Scytalidium lignicola]
MKERIKPDYIPDQKPAISYLDPFTTIPNEDDLKFPPIVIENYNIPQGRYPFRFKKERFENIKKPFRRPNAFGEAESSKSRSRRSAYSHSSSSSLTPYQNHHHQPQQLYPADCHSETAEQRQGHERFQRELLDRKDLPIPDLLCPASWKGGPRKQILWRMLMDLPLFDAPGDEYVSGPFSDEEEGEESDPYGHRKMRCTRQ